jgi:hypothetical protein
MAEAKKHSRVTGTERERLAATLRGKYEEGATVRELAEQTGRSYGFVYQILTGTGVALRGRGGDTRPPKT